MRAGFPVARRGMVVGLLGGSFDPAHEGHVMITREALKRMGLDRVWWLVSPGNPLKARQPAPMAARLARARALMRDPRVEVTDLEARLGTVYTADTVKRLQEIYPGVAFVWLMGADNLAQFSQWRDWRGIARTMPIAVIARPGYDGAAVASPAMAWLGRFRRSQSSFRSPERWSAPALVTLRFDPDARSATAIRQADPEWARKSMERLSRADFIRDGVTYHRIPGHAA